MKGDKKLMLTKEMRVNIHVIVTITKMQQACHRRKRETFGYSDSIDSKILHYHF